MNILHFFVILIAEYLHPSTEYIFYVRAWYDHNHVAEYTSNGIKIDGTSPEISRSKSVKELESWTSTSDMDFTKETSHVIVTWKGVFRDAETRLSRFVVSLGTRIGSHDTIIREYPGDVDKANLTSIRLSVGKHYFTTVEAFNEAGLHSLSHSDGFWVGNNIHFALLL